MIKFKIIEVNPDEHSIVVRFYTGILTEASLATQLGDRGEVLRCRTDYSIDLPIPAPTGNELKSFILTRAPTAWLEKQEAVVDVNIDTSLSTLTALVNVEMTAPATPSPSAKGPTVLSIASIRT